MPRISLWNNDRHSNDYTFFDKRISEIMTIGGVTSYIHMYTGPAIPANAVSNDPTMPAYSDPTVTDVQDLLFLENRDRNYDPDIYRLRAMYNVQDLDQDLSQFGLIISNGVLFITYHTNDMIRTLGRKLLSGDVIELPNLKDFYALNSYPVALKSYYVVQETTYSAEGYSPTWWSHLTRVKCTPMTDSQEFQEILTQPLVDPDGNIITQTTCTDDPLETEAGMLLVTETGEDLSDHICMTTVVTIGNTLSSYGTDLSDNDAIVQQGENLAPVSGYDTQPLFSPLFKDGNQLKTPLPGNASPEQKWTGYIVGDGTAINGYPVTSATNFPDNPTVGQYVLRLDYWPNRLFRFNGTVWTKVSDKVRTGMTPGTGKTERDRFINNANTFVSSSGNVEPVLQNLSDLFGFGDN